MKRLFLLSALVTLACSGEAAVTSADPQPPEVEVPDAPTAPGLADPESPSGDGTSTSCPGRILGEDCEAPTVDSRPLYSGVGGDDHWLVMAGDKLLFADTAHDSVLGISLETGHVSVIAENQPGVSWLGSDAGTGVWATQTDEGAAFAFKDLRGGQVGTLVEGIEAPERAVLGDGMVLWYDWAISGIVALALDDPSRVVTLVADASAHAATLSDGFLYYASELDQGSIRRVAVNHELESAESELVVGELGQQISKFGNHTTRDLQVVDGEIYFTTGTQGGPIWHIDANGALQNIGGAELRARNLTVVDGQAYWVTYGGSADQREGTLWTTAIPSGLEAASGEGERTRASHVVADGVGWVEHLAITDTAAFFTTSRTAGVFSVERLTLASAAAE